MITQDFYFEFAGMPKSGKTTIFDIVIHFLKRKGFSVGEYHGGGRFSPIDKSSLSSLNTYLAIKSVEFLLVNSEREKVQSKIFMMDRGIFDRCIFTHALNRMGKIDDKETQAIMNFLTIPKHTDLIDTIFLFVTNPELSIQREFKNKLIEKNGRVMNKSFLELLRSVTLDEYQKSTRVSSNFYLVDTEKYDGRIIECAQMITDKIMNKIGMCDD